MIVLNVLLGTEVWKTRETGLYRKLPLRHISVDACEFTPDGKIAVAVTIFGTVSLYSVPGRIPACKLAPVEQYMVCEFENPATRLLNQQETVDRGFCGIDGTPYPWQVNE